MTSLSLVPRLESLGSVEQFLIGTLTVTEVSLPVEALPTALDGYRIGMCSDLHLGPWVSSTFVHSAIQKLNELRPDIVCLLGDYIGIPDGAPGKYLPYNSDQEFAGIRAEHLAAPIAARLATICRDLRAPSYAVIGNHDRWLAPRAIGEAMTKSTSKLLINERIEIRRGDARIEIVGVDDYLTGEPRIAHLLDTTGVNARPLSKNTFRLLLAHNPDYIHQLLATTNASFDLALSGHTHGGQIKLPFFGAVLVHCEQSDFAEGLVVTERGAVFTSRGVGVVELPIRFNCPPEVAVITLRRA